MRQSLVTILMLLIFLATPQAGAEMMSIEEAGIAASNFMIQELKHDETWGDRAASEIAGCNEIIRDGRMLGYWVPIEPRGFIVVSLLRELPAIKAWSTETDFDPTAEEGLSALLMDTMGATLDFIEAEFGTLDHLPEIAPASNKQSWQWLVENGSRPASTLARGERSEVDPLIVCNWHQNAPFNDYCPMGDGGRTVVGCVATAAAMIMKYWEYPPSGTGTHTYTWSGDSSCNPGTTVGGGDLSAYYYDTYNWDHILTSYDGGYSAEEADAVAELCYEVGVAFDMSYGACGSSAYTDDGLYVFENYFNYKAGIARINRNAFTQDEYWAVIRQELDAEPPRPVQYTIHKHSIILDGYRDDAGRFYHMNYGWGGPQNAWYAIDNLFCNWDGCDFMREYMVVGIEPEGYFPVTLPGEVDFWRHGETPGDITWESSEAATIKVNLFRADELIGTVVDWIANTGSVSLGEVPAAWGSGANYRLKVIGDDNKFGWSETFGIFGAGGWADATDGQPLGDTGNSQGVAW
ncbi:MAG: hypothetical protein GY835_03945, partial [bacterium]|nr:hypothetical protein [bacterium]